MLALKPVLYLHCLGFDHLFLPHPIFGAQFQGFWGNGALWSPFLGCTVPVFKVWVSKPGSERSEVQILMAWVPALQSCHTCIKCGSSS